MGEEWEVGHEHIVEVVEPREKGVTRVRNMGRSSKECGGQGICLSLVCDLPICFG
mgnify:CR=1 FL=1